MTHHLLIPFVTKYFKCNGHLYLSFTQANNISKMAGPIGPPGFNGSQGPAGPAGSIGAPGPKGAGDFSACKYYNRTGTTSGGDSDANVDEPSVSQSKY